ncbi:L-rhamnono-gamma-lactonase [Neophaeococcomyces mojaviensis]|uniref:L-rhamnono-gamma-lactonase n=1 Tax=Neophaeococcomyces mojaviensis TaxID=3383035 RepID=A0ACC3AIM3_9EURO|nr:L-rhamnono-gamma-lactonase [Knufia sp. JES_112]
MALTDQQTEFPVIDSHIHLYAASHLKDLAWASTLPPSHVLNRQNSLQEYRLATKSCRNLLGFVFVETDRKSGLQEHEWEHAIEEIEFLTRIKSGIPVEGEGHTISDKSLLLGVVAWAPVPAGPQPLEAYLARADAALGPWKEEKLLRGYRYLVQDKPRGTQLQPEFNQSLHVLENSGCPTFDLGVDFRQGGHWQLLEAVEMLNNFYSSSTGSPRLKIIVNHLCKPNLQLTAQDAHSGHPDFTNWASCIQQLASFPTTYLKLSGLFSELPPQDPDAPTPILELVERTKPWIDAVFGAFGASRIMFGSDWPVCNVGGPGPDKAWAHWLGYVTAVLDDQKLSDGEKARVWAGTAAEAYDLGVIVVDST